MLLKKCRLLLVSHMYTYIGQRYFVLLTMALYRDHVFRLQATTVPVIIPCSTHRYKMATSVLTLGICSGKSYPRDRFLETRMLCYEDERNECL